MAENREKTAKRRGQGKPFEPGKSGNPGGRPPKTEEQRTLEAMCRERTTEALATILTIMGEGENERNKLAAAQFVIERGWGKAIQPNTLSGPDGGPIETSNKIDLSDLTKDERAALAGIISRRAGKS